MSVASVFASVLACAFVGGIAGCTSYFEKGYHPAVLEEKKIQSTRKVQIIKDDKIDLVIFATYLNDIEKSFYKNQEYFFVEFYAPSQEPLNLKRIQLEIAAQDNSWHTPLYMRKIPPSEYDNIFMPLNKWSSCYLVAFEKSENIDDEKVRLRVRVDEKADIFDFSFQVIPFQVI